jgi:hypothetical protein
MGLTSLLIKWKPFWLRMLKPPPLRLLLPQLLRLPLLPLLLHCHPSEEG